MSKKSNPYKEGYTPFFKRFLKYTFDHPIAKGRNRLTTLEVLIYGEIASYHASGNKAYPSVKKLAEDFGYDSTNPISAAIKALVEAGLISKTTRFNKSNVYNVIITPEQFGKMCDAQGVGQDAFEETTQQEERGDPEQVEGVKVEDSGGAVKAPEPPTPKSKRKSAIDRLNDLDDPEALIDMLS